MRLDNKDVIYLFAETEGKLIGMVGAVLNNEIKTKHIGYVIAVYVLPEFRGKGIGMKLIQSLIEECKKVGLEKLEISVTTTQKEAFALYKKIGFIENGVSHKALKVKSTYFDEILMEMFI